MDAQVGGDVLGSLRRFEQVVGLEGREEDLLEKDQARQGLDSPGSFSSLFRETVKVAEQLSKLLEEL